MDTPFNYVRIEGRNPRVGWQTEKTVQEEDRLTEVGRAGACRSWSRDCFLIAQLVQCTVGLGMYDVKCDEGGATATTTYKP